ncbi:odorant receptor 4-like [Nomia melanderi]|uniref:odorant receptor 4-like n=1 Tax=Nomia melanderi TaxID=2448451 RepID=UPI003FCD04F9
MKKAQKNKKLEMDFAMGWSQFNLTLLGVWPEPRLISHRKRRISSFVFWFTSIVSFMFICAPQTARLVLKSTNLDEVIENLSINVPIAFALTKQLVLRYNKTALTFLLGQILEDWSRPLPKAYRQTMLKSAKTSRMISIVCSTSVWMMLLAFLTLQVWNNMQNSSEADLEGFLHPAMFPYNTKKSPNFELTWLGQFIGTVLAGVAYSCFDTFLAVLVLHLCGQLSVLRLAVTNLVNTSNETNFMEFKGRLGYIVYRHNQLYRFAVILEDCFNLTLFVQTLICTAMLCLTGYRMLTAVDQTTEEMNVVGLTFFILHVVSTMMHFFIYCYVGETLVEESTGIAESAYDSIWYKLPPKQASTLINIIGRARISFQITAGKFSPFTLTLFNAILKTSAGYLSVLLAVNE